MGTTRALTSKERQHREERRSAAADLFDQGVPQVEVARRLGVTRQAAHHWHRLWQDGGRPALASTGPPGARSYLTEEQIEALKADLKRGAVAHGWQTERWTVPRIRQPRFGGRMLTVIRASSGPRVGPRGNGRG